MNTQVITIKTKAKSEMDTRRKLPLFEENPFMIMERSTTIEKTDKTTDTDSLNSLQTDTNTTTITKVEFVEEPQFIKIFTEDIKWFLGLTSPGIKVFVMLLKVVQGKIGADKIFFSFKQAKKLSKKLDLEISESTFSRGIRNLCEKNVIALSQDMGWLYVNPSLIFNGNRAQFVREYNKLPATQVHSKPKASPEYKPAPKVSNWQDAAISAARAQRAKVAL